MKSKLLTLLLAATLSVSMLCACGGDDYEAPAEAEVEEEAVEEDEEEVEEDAEESDDAAEDADVTYVDGFYANNGGDDFMIFFYETESGDLAYVNDGTDEAIAEYTVENAELDDGTQYLLVTVGNTQLGYYEDGDDIYIVDDEGSVYAAARLTEEEAEELHSMVTE